MNLEKEFDRLSKPLIDFIYKYYDADYTTILITGHDAFINHCVLDLYRHKAFNNEQTDDFGLHLKK